MRKLIAGIALAIGAFGAGASATEAAAPVAVEVVESFRPHPQVPTGCQAWGLQSDGTNSGYVYSRCTGGTGQHQAWAKCASRSRPGVTYYAYGAWTSPTYTSLAICSAGHDPYITGGVHVR